MLYFIITTSTFFATSYELFFRLLIFFKETVLYKFIFIELLIIFIDLKMMSHH